MTRFQPRPLDQPLLPNLSTRSVPPILLLTYLSTRFPQRPLSQLVLPKRVSQTVLPKPVNQLIPPKQVNQTVLPKPVDQLILPKPLNQTVVPTPLNQTVLPKLSTRFPPRPASQLVLPTMSTMFPPHLRAISPQTITILSSRVLPFPRLVRSPRSHSTASGIRSLTHKQNRTYVSKAATSRKISHRRSC